LGLEGLVRRLPDSLVKQAENELAGGGGVAVVEAVNWEQSDAVFLHGGIFVLDESRRDEIIEELESAFKTFTDERGNKVIDEVYRGDEVYDGPHVGDGPDLVPIARDHKMLDFSGDEELFDPDDDWIAGHEMDGLFVANGPDFGSQSGVEVSIYDVMPTILPQSVD
jgi:predicted AlkP superfamily phosphohydrolase/phosphomutase